jgi:hypothetical protein
MKVVTTNITTHKGHYKNYKGEVRDKDCGGGKKTLRKCLGPGCERMFESLGSGNRMCPTCSDPRKRISTWKNSFPSKKALK